MGASKPFTKVTKWWLPLVGSTAALLVVVAVILIAEATGTRPPKGREQQVEPLGVSDGSIHLAGTGTWLPLARALAEAFVRQHPDQELVVHQSIGSSGGRRAAADGAVDIGLISHRRGHPRAPEGCVTVEVARAAVVFAVHPSVPIGRIARSEVIDIFLGRDASWPDGTTIVPLLRESGDSSTQVARRVIPGFAEAVADARVHGRWATLMNDADMGQALSSTPGAIGLYDLGAIGLEGRNIRPLVFDGNAPTVEALAEDRYPMTRTLSMLIGESPRPGVRAFIEFVTGEPGRGVIRDSGGYLPLRGAP